MKRVIFLGIFFALLINCKKINYEAVFAIDDCKRSILDGEAIVSSIRKLSDREIIPIEIKSHLIDLINQNANTDCFDISNEKSILNHLEGIRFYLLYRKSELSKSLICSINPGELYAHQLDEVNATYLTITGINLTYEEMRPRYLRNGSEVDITSLYCQQDNNEFTIQLGGPNGLPIDQSVDKLIIGEYDDFLINVYHSTPNTLGLTYQAHVEKRGWLPPKKEGEWVGTKGEGLRIESFLADFNQTDTCKFHYKIHQKDYGTSEWIPMGTAAGKSGDKKQIEAIQIELINCSGHRFEYQGHIENVGDTDWIKEGEWLGSPELGQRLEAIKIKILANSEMINN